MTSKNTPCAPTWIWYPGDFEIWLGNEMNNRRTERGAFFPPFWKTDSHFSVVEFSKKLRLAAAEEIEIAVEGRYNVKLNGKLQFGEPSKLLLSAGEHCLNIKVYNQAAPPALWVKGKTFASDSSWQVTPEDKEWIDESGKASDTSATVYMSAGCWNFNDVGQKPSAFRLAVQPENPVKTEKVKNGELVDFGKETFGFIRLHGLKGNGEINLYYGESPEEAQDTERCETLDKLSLAQGKATDLALNATTDTDEAGCCTLSNSKAFRYVYVEKSAGVSIERISMLYEYLPVEYRGAFRCNDEELNKIWDIGAYTMHLTTREFFIDGIKRDRWVWSGDAVQSCLMSYYLFFDRDSVKRTIWLLRGKEPVTSHINTIMDYTFYWFISIFDYYQHSGDRAFIEQVYPRMVSLMDYVLSRRNARGLLEGLDGDWVFIDWADFKMSKKGEVSFEQLLFCRALEAMAMCAEVLGKKEDATAYTALANDLKEKLLSVFWSTEKSAFVHNIENGRQSEQVTPYTNMFAVLLGYLNAEKTEAVRKNVLMNPAALKITTPYMRFYELEALCKLGYHEYVTAEIKDYWGGMLAQGATSFWEKYTPAESGAQHLAMYGRPYGKSLCHAWGASPIYLFGKYYLGVTPVQAGYGEFRIAPQLGGLEWIDGKVPAPKGDIAVYMNKNTIKVKADSGKGYLYFNSKETPSANFGSIEKINDNEYRLPIESGRWYEVKI